MKMSEVQFRNLLSRFIALFYFFFLHFSDSLAENCREECQKLDVGAMFCSDCGDIIATICDHHPTLSVFFLEKLTKRKRKEICTVLLHTRGSRCVESIIFNVAKLIDDNPFAIQMITEITETAIAEFERLSGDFSGSHVLRCLGRVLCGVGKNQEKNSNGSTPAEFRSLLISLMGLVLNWTYISSRFSTVTCFINFFLFN